MKILGAFARLYRLTSGWRSVVFQQGKERVLAYQSITDPTCLVIEQLIGERRTISIHLTDVVSSFRGLSTFNLEGAQCLPGAELTISAQELRDLCDWIGAAHALPFIPTNKQFESTEEGAFEAALIFQRCMGMMAFYESACLRESGNCAENDLRIVANHSDLYDSAVMVYFQLRGLSIEVWFHADGKISQFGDLPTGLSVDEMRQLCDRLASATLVDGR